jgi:Asp-tRNA(Asn)/Glu-tRNA(Gln) amidotransferase A subunit family amidase
VDEELRWSDGLAQADLVRSGRASPAELEAEARERIRRLGPGLNALVWEAGPGGALPGPPVAAHDAGLPPPAGAPPFAGVPFLVKDLALEIAGTPFREGSRWTEGTVSAHTAGGRSAGSSTRPAHDVAVLGALGHAGTGRSERSTERPPPPRNSRLGGRARIGAGEYLSGVEELQRFARRAAGFFADVDVWLTPTMGGPPVPLGTLTGTDEEPLRGEAAAGGFLMFDAEYANITGGPAMSVPAGLDGDGLPLAVAFLGSPGEDARLMALAAQLEAVRPWAHLHPPVLHT